MAKQTYRGSCQCKRVTFEADIDLSLGTGKCNCTICWKHRWWSVRVATEDFRSLTGEAELVHLKSAVLSQDGGFCPHCGVRMYFRVDKADWNDGAYVSVNVASLDNLEAAAIIAAPVKFMDGRADNWWTVPAETRHL